MAYSSTPMAGSNNTAIAITARSLPADNTSRVPANARSAGEACEGLVATMCRRHPLERSGDSSQSACLTPSVPITVGDADGRASRAQRSRATHRARFGDFACLAPPELLYRPVDGTGVARRHAGSGSVVEDFVADPKQRMIRSEVWIREMPSCSAIRACVMSRKNRMYKVDRSRSGLEAQHGPRPFPAPHRRGPGRRCADQLPVIPPPPAALDVRSASNGSSCAPCASVDDTTEPTIR